MIPQPTPIRKRCKRFNTPGHFHFLTFSCYRRQPFLSKDRTCHWLADSIRKSRTRHSFKLIAYVFMPEHVHLLFRPTEQDYSISRILAAVKTPVARTARSFILQNAPDFLSKMLDQQPNGERHFRFWQRGGGYDRNIYTPHELWEKIDYIHRNPVRRKLVTNPVDWLWSSAADFANIREGPLPVDNQDLPWLPQ